MEKVPLHRKHRFPIAAVSVAAGLIFSVGPTMAQQAPKAPIATITVTTAPFKALRDAQRLSIYGNTFLAISASVPVPYGDLNLTQETGASELGRRIHLAARIACEQLQVRYPPERYPVVGTDDCAQSADSDGMAKANEVIAAAKK